MVDDNDNFISPTYVIHPSVKKLLDDPELDIDDRPEFDPMMAPSFYRSYRTEFLDKRPLKDQQPITSKVTEITRLRSSDHKREYLVWTENQSFKDAMLNDIPFQRPYCGVYSVPKFFRSTVAEGGTMKSVKNITGWVRRYEVQFNVENANKLRALAENQATLKTIVETEDDTANVFALREKDYEKWLKWDFEALEHYCQDPKRFNAEADAVELVKTKELLKAKEGKK